MKGYKRGNPPIVTLTTDFGLSDPYVGIMKGVMLNIHRGLNIVDISHQIEPQNILETVHVISHFYSYFPKDTIHTVVVDPGVGTVRRPLIVQTEDYTFVAPDNGVLTGILRDPACKKIIDIRERWFLPKGIISSTFHGRDIFSPVAAWLALGKDIYEFGPETDNCITIELPEAKQEGGSINGEVIYIDIFGNIITNIPDKFIGSKKKEAVITFPNYPDIIISGIRQAYEGAGHYPCALINSWGMIEIFIANKSAYKELGIEVGTAVELSFGLNL